MGKTIRNGKTITESSVVKGGGSTKDFIQDWINAGGGFGGSANLTDQDLEGINIDTSGREKYQFMFANCSNLTTLDLTKFDLNKKLFSYMFYGCTNLEEVKGLEGYVFDTLTSGSYLFYNCKKLNLDKLTFNSISSLQHAFSGCESLTDFYLKMNASSQRVLCTYIFSRCTNLKNVTIDLGTKSSLLYIVVDRAFYGCSNLEAISFKTVEGISFGIRNMLETFKNCSKLKMIDLSDFEGTYQSISEGGFCGTFESCSSLETVVLPKFDSYKSIIQADKMFYGCSSLKYINFNGYNGSGTINMQLMFGNCSSLVSLDLSNWDTSKTTSMHRMFEGCSSLTEIPALDLSNVTTMLYMFDGCTSLTAIHCTGMKVSFDISASTLFTREALLEIINNCATVTITQTLTIGEENLAKLTDEDKLIATNKGWTLA